MNLSPLKKSLIIIGLFCSFSAFGQKVNLNWKIGNNETLNYLTVMRAVDSSQLDFNLGGLFNSFSDSTGNGLNEVKDLFKNLNKTMQNYDYVSTLSNAEHGVIDITMTSKPKEQLNSEPVIVDKNKKKEADFTKLMQSMMQGVVLRGSVFADGGVHSFWLKSSQKNLIAILFELPMKSVKIGDRWSLDIDLIANDQSFICDSSYKINEVTLSDLKMVNGDTIAILTYNIVEYVKGNMVISNFSDKDKSKQALMMKFTHQAIAEFSVNKGCWIAYEGIMSLNSTGFMTAKTHTKFSLVKS